MIHSFQSIPCFWLKHPALFYGVAWMLGIYSQMADPLEILLPALFFWLPFLWVIVNPLHREFVKPLALSAGVFFTAWVYTASLFSSPSIPQDGLLGNAKVAIKSISLQNNLFGKKWIYRCEIKQFSPLDSSISEAISLPCIIALPSNKNKDFIRPFADKEYWTYGKLIQKKKNTYLFKVSSKTKWIPIFETNSIAESRYHWKKSVSHWIKSKFSSTLSADFLAGVTTGEFDDYWMRQQFSRFGLQHLLAISGFHFSLIAAFLSFILSFFVPLSLRCVLLILALSAYAFFLGPQASILRAWMMCLIVLVASLIEKPAVALNSLGLALLLTLSFNPFLSLDIGFQLSFATTAAILLFYSPAKKWGHSLIPKRSLKEVLEMTLLNQHAYCVLSFLRQGLILTFAVSLFALPLTLFYFQQWPVLGFFYNLFFPLLASISLFLLLFASAFAWIPFLSDRIHQINDHYTHFILQLTSQIPITMDAYLKVDPFSAKWLIAYFCVACLGGIVWKEVSQIDEKEPFEFI